MASIFSLPHLSALDLALPPLPSGPQQPAFTLPRLDEDAPGVERLLGTPPRPRANGVNGSAGSGPSGLAASMNGKEVNGALPLGTGAAKAWPFDLTRLTTSAEKPFEVETTQTALDVEVEDQVDDGLWSQAAAAGPSTGRAVHTWDDGPAPLLSEQRMEAFESLVATTEPTTSRGRPAARPATAKSLLDLMMKASLGTTVTDDLRWSKREARFVYSETGARPLGVERGTAAHALQRFLTIGTAVRRLEIIVERHGSTPITPTHHALLHALTTLMTLVKDKLSACVQTAVERDGAPWLKRGMEMEELQALLEALCEVMCWPIEQAKAIGLPARPAAVLTHLHSHLVARLNTSSEKQQRGYVALALAFLLSRSSQPILDLLHEWIGLADSSTTEENDDPEYQPWQDLGIIRTRLPPADGVDVRWDYSFSARRMPAFVPKEVRRTLFEAGRSLRVLREASRGLHPLCQTWPLRASWGWGASEVPKYDLRTHARRVQREIERWRGSGTRTRSLSAASISSARFGKKRPTSVYTVSPPASRTGTPPNATISLPPTNDDLWSLFSLPPGTHLANDPTPLWTPTPPAELEAFIARHEDPDHPLLPSTSPTLDLYISQHLLAPLLAHANLTSRALISLYLDDLHFLDHLDVLHAFWLGGDAGFSERVAAALFGKEDVGPDVLGMGQRERTRARLGLAGPSGRTSSKGKDTEGEWGVGLGLGLSDRNRWPPGGAELAYALRTTLLDDEVAHLAYRGAAWEGLEDRVSFAVRALPEDDKDGRRARWLDPQAIEALDFLYLSYSPPAALAVLLPGDIMDKYQQVHNLLLRISRVEAVLRGLYFDTLKPAGESSKTGVDAKRGKQAFSHNAKESLFPPGSDADRTLQYLRFSMAWFTAALGKYLRDTAIERHVAVMRRRLDKLRRRSGAPVDTGSRPVTPGGDYDDEYEDLDEELDEAGQEEDEEVHLGALSQLQSVHSLVLYHRIILNRILRACLLADKAGHQVTFKILMALFCLILDLGKVVHQVARGAVPVHAGAATLESIRQDWSDKLAVFLHALERLSLRAPSGDAEGADQDLQLLLDTGEETGARAGTGSAELHELVLRLKLGQAGGRAR